MQRTKCVIIKTDIDDPNDIMSKDKGSFCIEIRPIYNRIKMMR